MFRTLVLGITRTVVAMATHLAPACALASMVASRHQAPRQMLIVGDAAAMQVEDVQLEHGMMVHPTRAKVAMMELLVMLPRICNA